MKSVLLTLIMSLGPAIAAHASASFLNETAIICTYPSGESLVFQTRRGTDITNPVAAIQEGTLPLFVNGDGPVHYAVAVQNTRLGKKVIYSNKSQFHVNDITINYIRSEDDEYVYGTHQTDYAEVQLECRVCR